MNGIQLRVLTDFSIGLILNYVIDENTNFSFAARDFRLVGGVFALGLGFCDSIFVSKIHLNQNSP